MKKKAFTLIELIAVLVILAILALIVTPLVMNIIRKARVSADKRSIDAYGRSVELAIATYLLDNGDFPTNISDLTIEYSGDRVECSTTQLNSDSSVYLAGCTVAGRSVDGYTYGSDKSPTYTAYNIGDQITYNNLNYYVIKDSGAKESMVTLLKSEPLSYEDVQTYSAGTGARTSNSNGYGGMEYGETSHYLTSYVKATVDAWKNVNAPVATEARLITIDEVSSLGYEWKQTCPTCGEGWVRTDEVPTWVYNSNYDYWTMTPVADSVSDIYRVADKDEFSYGGPGVRGYGYVVRPVITISKTALSN